MQQQGDNTNRREGVSVTDVTTPATCQTAPAPPTEPYSQADDAELPPELGRMQCEAKIADGGMGAVIRAHDPTLGRRVAVKLIHADLDDEAKARFEREAKLTAQLEHPNIVPLYDHGIADDGRPYLVMRLVEGQSLERVIHGLAGEDPETVAQWSRHRLLTVFLKVCQAVAYAHDRGVLHRDLKPANIMLGEYGDVLVLDWGIARFMSEVHAGADDPHGATPDDSAGAAPRYQTSAGKITGTPGYLSPEVLEGCGGCTERRDVWSLGAILYELLTYTPAYDAAHTADVLRRTVEGPPEPPGTRAPQNAIPDEIADVCMKALAGDPDDRYQQASELTTAVEAFLEGSKRRTQAAALVSQARDVWTRYLQLGMRREELLGIEKRLADVADSWAPLSEKRDLMGTRDEIASLEPRRAQVFGECVALCEKALGLHPGDAAARGALADAYWDKLVEAEQRRDSAGIAYFSERVATFDLGQYAVLLEGSGALSIDTEPSGTEVLCSRFEARGLVYPTTDERSLGTTPLREVPLERGSYLIKLRHPGRPDVIYPVHITRCHHWKDDDPIPIPEAYDDRFAYVAQGPFVCGGDPDAPGSGPRTHPDLEGFFIARFQVTMAEYLEFLNELHERDPSEAWARTPRSEASLVQSDGQYFARPQHGGRYEMPDTDSDGNAWDPRWPVFGVSWRDAMAYAEWASQRDGVRYRLPLEEEFEKAARGVDGRFYPWGDGFDRTLCKMGDSRRGRARPESVGTFKTDVSIYGVHDTAGSMRDWCGDESFDDDSTLRPVRGGSWNYDPRFCRSACRLGRAPWRVFAYNGFRLAYDLTPA